jgi:hypothetical protein
VGVMAIATKVEAWWRAVQELMRPRATSPTGGKDRDELIFPTKEARRVDELRRACGVTLRPPETERAGR